MTNVNKPQIDKINKIINTTKQVQDDPMITLLQALLGGTENAVEREEKRGQEQAVQSEVLPSKGLDKYMPGGPYEKLGFIIGEHVEGDDMWRYVTLPEGWTKKATDHSMHNNVLDKKGRKRASFFYKAAFYDRDAIMYPPVCRYEVVMGADYKTERDGTSVFSYDVIDNNTQVDFTDSYGGTYKRGMVICNVKHTWTEGQPIPEGSEITDRWKLQDFVQNEAKAWLAKNFPDYQNPVAYWD